MKGLATVAAALLVAAMPYLLYAVAQTSRLHEAARSNDIQRIHNAYKPWKFIDGRDPSGATPLQIAISRGNRAAAEFFLDSGASLWPPKHVNLQTDYLDMAARLGRVELVSLLLDRGAPINNSRAICSAVESLNVDIVTLLLRRGADPNATKQQYQHVPALFCLPYGKRSDSRPFQIMDVLLKHGADIGYHLPDGNSLLSNAMYRNPVDAEMMRFLVVNGFPLKPGPKGGTPLQYAAQAKLVDAVRALLEAGADANDFGIECTSRSPTSCRGRTTALHEAVDLTSHQYPERIPQSIEITTMLLKHGANPNVLDNSGHSALFHATYSSNHGAATLLLEAGANPAFAAPPGKSRHQSGAIDP